MTASDAEALRELVEILSDYLRPGHAYEVGEELIRARAHAARYASLLARARATVGRERRGRPSDSAERDLEARVLAILEANGVKSTDSNAGTAAQILAILHGDITAEPRNAVRRARRRLKTLRTMAEASQASEIALPQRRRRRA